jgi:hypothetical protein
MNRKQELDKDKLQLAVATGMKTIMIGAIASIEEKLGKLWGHGKKTELTANEQFLSDIFSELRKAILDKGNTQIRQCKQIIDGYTVEFSGYSITLPVVRRKE